MKLGLIKLGKNGMAPIGERFQHYYRNKTGENKGKKPKLLTSTVTFINVALE